MSEFNIEDLDELIRTAESSLVQMLALQLKKSLRQLEHGEEWIKRSERMPIKSSDFENYMEIEVNVFDGHEVSTALCRAGNPGGNESLFWCEFDRYGMVNPDDITHWKPLPSPPVD